MSSNEYKKKRVLIIDDSVDLRDVISIHLKSKGYDVIQANDGSEGLDVIKKNLKLDCIICDLQMPNVSGLMFLKIIREKEIKNAFDFHYWL